MLRAIRGAITTENTEKAMLADTRDLLAAMIEKNVVKNSEIISVIFSATPDLDAVYPAKAARDIGLTSAGLMCFSEMSVENSLKKCIRVLMHIESEKEQSEIIFVYLKEARKLRPDITEAQA